MGLSKLYKKNLREAVSDQEIQKRAQKYIASAKENSYGYQQQRQDLESLAAGGFGNDDLMKHFEGWEQQDFQKLLQVVDGSIEKRICPQCKGRAQERCNAASINL